MFFSSILILFNLAVRNVWRNPRRSVLTMLAIAVGVWSILSLSALARGLSEQIIYNSIHNLRGHIQIHANHYLSDPAPEYSLSGFDKKLTPLLNTPLVSGWSTRVRVPAVISSERKSTGITLVGINPEQEKGLSFIGDGKIEGKYLSSIKDPGILIGEALAKELKTRIGKRIVIVSHTLDNKVADRGFRIIGLFKTKLESTEKAYVFVGLKVAQEMLKLGESVSEVSILLKQSEMVPEVLSEFRKEFPHEDVQSWDTLEPISVALVRLQHGFMVIWFFVVFIVVAFGLVNTQFMAIFERTREFGLLQALGLKPYLIIIQVLFESFVLLIIGMAIGNMANMFCLHLLKDGIDISRFSEGAAVAGISSVLYPFIKISDIVQADVLIVVLGLLSGFFPAWKAGRTIPVDAMTRG